MHVIFSVSLNDCIIIYLPSPTSKHLVVNLNGSVLTIHVYISTFYFVIMKCVIKKILKGKIAESKRLCLFILVRLSQTVICRGSTYRIMFPMTNHDVKLVRIIRNIFVIVGSGKQMTLIG